MTSADPHSIVELTISCHNLRNLDYLSKSDPMCVVSIKMPNVDAWSEIGRTEVIQDNLSPEFSKKITMTYLFEARQLLRFDVYDIDSTSQNLADHDFIGRAEAALGEIVSCSSITIFKRNLIGSKSETTGELRVTADELSSFKEAYSLKLEAENLPHKWIGASSFFFEIHKSTENQGMLLVHRSETISTKKNCAWRLTQIGMHTLCNGDVDRNIKITLFKHKANGSHESLGDWHTTTRTMGDSNLPLAIKLPSSGAVIRLVQFTKGSHSTFLDFIRIGVQMHCSIAVDFTQSNGEPRQPNSLHFMDPYKPNQYQTALKAVLEIIQDYDSDKLFPCLGFGALVPPSYTVSHEFFLNFHPNNPYCQGVEGVMSAYAQSLSVVKLYGPTNFAPVINHVSQFAVANRDGSNYFILLIITDGIISDIVHTKNAIVAASTLPMSIIIVGVGNADFSAMNELDADEHPLVDTNGRGMERDIVQFVPFNEILSKAGGDVHMAKVELAREVLAEVPGQFLSYMAKIGMTPEKLAAKSKLNSV